MPFFLLTFPIVDPVAVQFGPLAIRWYGLAYVAGFVAGILLYKRLARQGYFDPVKLDASTTIMGGTVGGPIMRNRLFYFGGWERNQQNQSRFNQYSVPTGWTLPMRCRRCKVRST